MVVIRPLTMPKLSASTLAIGATQLVVHEALEITSWCCGSYLSSLTPITIVMSSPLAGAEMITFRAPAVRCAAAASREVNRPVDSITTSMPRSPSAVTSTSSLPSTVSYFSRCALVAGSVRSFAATISISLPCAAWTARQKFRPIRPNPLMPTRIVTAFFPSYQRLTLGGSSSLSNGPCCQGMPHRPSSLLRVGVDLRDTPYSGQQHVRGKLRLGARDAQV